MPLRPQGNRGGIECDEACEARPSVTRFLTGGRGLSLEEWLRL